MVPAYSLRKSSKPLLAAAQRWSGSRFCCIVAGTRANAHTHIHVRTDTHKATSEINTSSCSEAESPNAKTPISNVPGSVGNSKSPKTRFRFEFPENSFGPEEESFDASLNCCSGLAIRDVMFQNVVVANCAGSCRIEHAHVYNAVLVCVFGL